MIRPATLPATRRMGRALALALAAGMLISANTEAATTTAPAPAAKAAAPIALVAAQSEVGFVAKQLGVPLNGRFKRFGVQTNFNPKSPQTSQIALSFDLASITVSAEADPELGKPEWFAAARFPQASFQSTAIKAVGVGKFDVAGKLTIKGTTRDVTVPVQIAQAGGLTTATGALNLKRLDFKVGDGEWTDTSIVADEVQVKFKLVLQGVASM